MKKHATDWEKMFAKDMSDRELLSKIPKEFLKFSNRKTPNLKNEPQALTDNSPKKIYRQKISI